MRLTKQTGHALRLLVECARSGAEHVKVAAVAAQLDLTNPNMFKIVHILVRAGFLKTIRGPHGGVKLSRKPAQIRIGDVVRATETTAIEVEGHTAGGRRAGGTTAINRVLDDALEAFISVLDKHTLADLASSETSPLLAPRRARKQPVRALKARAQ
jgi:Rrf2 family nitric oxide-sensitive transcriptional repressor